MRTPRRGCARSSTATSSIRSCARAITIAAAVVTLVIVLAALLAPWIAPHDPFDLSKLNLLDSHNPPAWLQGGDWRFLLGTDDQGRDMFSTILYGSRQSIAIGVMATLFAGLARHRARADRRLCGRRGRRRHHARRRRAAHLPGDPDRAADRRHLARAVRRAAQRAGRVLGAGALDRPVVLGAICAHGARLDAGREGQGICAGRAPDRHPRGQILFRQCCRT